MKEGLGMTSVCFTDSKEITKISDSPAFGKRKKFEFECKKEPQKT